MLTISKKKWSWKWDERNPFLSVFLDLFPLSAFAPPLTHLTSAELNQLDIVSDSGENTYSLFYFFLRLGEVDAYFIDFFFFLTDLNQCQKHLTYHHVHCSIFSISCNGVKGFFGYWINPAWRGIFASCCNNNNTCVKRCCWLIRRHELTPTYNTNSN